MFEAGGVSSPVNPDSPPPPSSPRTACLHLLSPRTARSGGPGPSPPAPRRVAAAVLDPGSEAGATTRVAGVRSRWRFLPRQPRQPASPSCHPGRRGAAVRGPARRHRAGSQRRCWTPARRPGRQRGWPAFEAGGVSSPANPDSPPPPSSPRTARSGGPGPQPAGTLPGCSGGAVSVSFGPTRATM